MTRFWIPLVLLLLRASSSVAAQAVQPPSRTDSATVVAWIRQSAIPLRSVRAGSGFADLQPLKRVLQNVRVLGLGEATHGTREFQQMKHRLLEFLVIEMGFTAIAIEAAYSDAQPINDYVLTGKGKRADVLTGQGYIAWDTEEFGAMLDWLRAYNRGVPEPNRVRFYGVDLFRNSVGRRKVLSMVRRAAPQLELSTDSLFRVLAREEEHWPLWDTTAVASARPLLAALSDVLRANRDSLRSRVAEAEIDEALQLITVMQQGAALTRRSTYMGENLLYLLEHERPGTKFMFSAANGHVWMNPTGNAGLVLRQRLDDAYYAAALDYDHGTYQARVFPPPGDLKVVRAPPTPPGSLEWYLARTRSPQFFLDVRTSPRDSVVERWLDLPRNRHAGSWAVVDSSRWYVTMNVRDRFDGILFVAHSTPTHPTANARKTAARKASF